MSFQFITDFLVNARKGKPVFITDLRSAFTDLDNGLKHHLTIVVELLGQEGQRLFELYLPLVTDLDEHQSEFVKSYLQAEIYNILCTLGGLSMTIYLDTAQKDLVRFVAELNETFETKKPRSARKGYGRALNVIERIKNSLEPEKSQNSRRGFHFLIKDLTQLPNISEAENEPHQDKNRFKQATRNLAGKAICGVDIGGTNNKIVLVVDGCIRCIKEYSWFPTKFKTPIEQIKPICLLVRLVKAKVSLENNEKMDPKEKLMLIKRLEKAFQREATDTYIKESVETVESALNEELIELDAIGVSFPDVVIRDKIVGGEVYKMRGMRENPEINYEQEFIRITHLDDHLSKLGKKNCVVKIINDGSMAAFTAAAELSCLDSTEMIKEGIFAHSLGTELGTGWVNRSGLIPEIPLEVYNIIIDLGSFVERDYHCDDVRSINNFNTGLSGTLQKYTSQYGVFRLALKHFAQEREDLYQELFARGFVEKKEKNAKPLWVVPTEPIDKRKPLMGHLMQLLDREDNQTIQKVFRKIGLFLAITWFETERTLKPAAKSRQLFGGLITHKKCYQLIQDGAESLIENVRFDIANEDMANSSLMKQLENFSDFKVGQLATAIGAVYYANLGLQQEKREHHE